MPNKKADFLKTLESIINNRKSEGQPSSYTASLFAKGINKIAQKVGEEAVELVIEAKDDNLDLFLNEEIKCNLTEQEIYEAELLSDYLHQTNQN